jgi:DNA-binding LacI/PurR family transcriptional regulator
LPLTTMSHPVQQITDAAVELLVDRLENDYSGPPRTRTVHGELIIRKSTLPLDAAIQAGKRA